MIKVLIPCVLLFSPALVQAQDNVRVYNMTNGERVRGEVMSVEGDEAKLKIYFGQGSMSRKYPLSDFTPPSNYAIRAAVVSPTDAEANLELARYAVSTNQVAAARRSLTAARKAAGNPSLGGDVEAELKLAPVRALEADFDDQVKKGYVTGAERTLRTLRVKYSAVVRPDKIHALEDQLAAAKKKREAEIVAAKAAKENERMVAARERKLKPLQKRLDDATSYRDRGMQNSKNFGSAQDDFKRAIRLCEIVMKEAGSLEKSHGNDPVMVRELRAMDQQAGGMRTNMLLTTASLQITHGQLNAAMGNVNKVLAMDPDNRQAQAMRGRIEVAANSGWGW